MRLLLETNRLIIRDRKWNDGDCKERAEVISKEMEILLSPNEGKNEVGVKDMIGAAMYKICPKCDKTNVQMEKANFEDEEILLCKKCGHKEPFNGGNGIRK